MPKNSQKTILVTGATGQQGGSVLRHVRDKGFSVRAFTRDPDSPHARTLVGRGTEVVRGNLNEAATVTRALDGVHGVYSVQTPFPEGVEAESRQGVQLAEAAQRQRINHLVYSSVGSADRHTGLPHFESKYKVEEYIRGSGLRYTIFRPVYFMENWLGMRDRIEAGTLPLPLAPETRLQMITVSDIGAFVAMAFERPGHWQDRAVDIAGDELSMSALAEIFARMVGRHVQYVQVPWDEFEGQAGHEAALMYRWFEEVGYNVDIGALRQEHPHLMSFETWLQSNWRPRVQTA